MSVTGGKSGVQDAAGAAAGMDGMMALHQRQLEAMTGALKSALDGAHQVANRQCEALAEAHRQFAVLLWRGAKLPTGNTGMTPGLDFAKRAFETCFAQTVALTEIATKAQLEALSVFDKTVADTLAGATPIRLGAGKDPARP
jgi:hypothetical protein